MKDDSKLTPFEEISYTCMPEDSLAKPILEGMHYAEDGDDDENPAMTCLVKMNGRLFQSIRADSEAKEAIQCIPEDGGCRYRIYQSRVELCDEMPDDEMIFFASKDLFSFDPSDYSRVVRMKIEFAI